MTQSPLARPRSTRQASSQPDYGGFRSAGWSGLDYGIDVGPGWARSSEAESARATNRRKQAARERWHQHTGAVLVIVFVAAALVVSSPVLAFIALLVFAALGLDIFTTMISLGMVMVVILVGALPALWRALHT